MVTNLLLVSKKKTRLEGFAFFYTIKYHKSCQLSITVVGVSIIMTLHHIQVLRSILPSFFFVYDRDFKKPKKGTFRHKNLLLSEE